MNISRDPQDMLENEITMGEALNSIWESSILEIILCIWRVSICFVTNSLPVTRSNTKVGFGDIGFSINGLHGFAFCHIHYCSSL
jgi:hypothetical protein